MRMIVCAGCFWLAVSTVLAGEPCVDHCLVYVEQPHGEYVRSATIRLSVRNASAEPLSLAVVLDALIDGAWRETPLTVSDQDHGFKVVRLSPVQPGAELLLNFPACASLKVVPRGGGGRDILVPCPKDVPSPAHPLRLHVFVHGAQGGVRQEVVSFPYGIRPD